MKAQALYPFPANDDVWLAHELLDVTGREIMYL